MRKLFKQTKVVYDAHGQCYDVYYKNFFVWKFDVSYRVGMDRNDSTARRLAIERAQNMLHTVEIWRS